MICLNKNKSVLSLTKQFSSGSYLKISTDLFKGITKPELFKETVNTQEESLVNDFPDETCLAMRILI